MEKSRFRLPFQQEHGKRVSTLFTSERQHLRYIFCSTGVQFSCNQSLLVLCQRLRLFFNTMSAVDKCSLPNRDNLMQLIHMQVTQKLKTPFQFFHVFPKSKFILNIFKKKITVIAYLFLRLRPAKTWLDICVKSPASDYPSKRKMVNGCQLCLNLSDSTCGIFIAQRGGNLVAKSLF